jgi:hypothetical protein
MSSVVEVNLGGPTLPTEGDEVFELELNNEMIRSSSGKQTFNSEIGAFPCRIYCPECRSSVISSIEVRAGSFWQEFFNGMRCCNNKTATKVIIHNCPRCGEELERVSCELQCS